MLTIKGDKYKNSTEFVEDANRLLSFYGFESLNSLLSEKKSTSFKRVSGKPEYLSKEEKELLDFATILISDYDILNLKENGFYYSYNFDPKNGQEYSMHAIALDNFFAESLLISMFAVMLKKILGIDIIVELNSMGDKDSIEKYYEDTRKYLKRNRKKLPAKVFKFYEDGNILKSVSELAKTDSALLENAPSLLNYLTDGAQKHLYAVLDYLDNAKVSYNLNPYLFGSSDIWKHVIFRIYEAGKENETLIASGGRIDNAFSSLFDKNGHVVTLKVPIQRLGRKSKVSKTDDTQKRNKKFYFIQLGSLAKAQALDLLEQMMDSNLQVEHNIGNLSLLDQYSLAQKSGAKYAIILGHKEAIDGTVIVRNIETQIQEIIAQKDLLKKLKKLK